MSEVLLLIISLFEVALAPLIAGLARRSATLFAATDSFVATSVGTLTLIHILPHTYRVAGAKALAAAAAGALIPLGLHYAFHRLERRALPALVWLVLGALAFHAMLDGAALALPGLEQDHGGDHDHPSVAGLIGAAILLHRFPMVLGIWWFALPLLGRRAATALLSALGVGTVVGFLAAEASWAALGSQPIALVQALVAGMLFHVLIGHEGLADSPSARGRRRWAIVLGTILAMTVTVTLATLGALELPFASPVSALITTGACLAVALYVIQARWRQRLEHGHAH